MNRRFVVHGSFVEHIPVMKIEMIKIEVLEPPDILGIRAIFNLCSSLLKKLIMYSIKNATANSCSCEWSVKMEFLNLVLLSQFVSSL